jgi:uncharacterized membrane protein
MQTTTTPSNLPIVPNEASFTVNSSRWVAVAALLGLIVLGLAWELVFAPLRPGGSWLALKVVPLCIPIAGLLKNRMYTYRWVSLVIWLYFIEGVVRAWGDKAPGNLLALLEVVLCIVLFAACTVHIRIRQRDALAALALEPATTASA